MAAQLAASQEGLSSVRKLPTVTQCITTDEFCALVWPQPKTSALFCNDLQSQLIRNLPPVSQHYDHYNHHNHYDQLQPKPQTNNRPPTRSHLRFDRFPFFLSLLCSHKSLTSLAMTSRSGMMELFCHLFSGLRLSLQNGPSHCRELNRQKDLLLSTVLT
jgi:hypothetical protein